MILLACIALGIIAGMFFPIHIPIDYSQYIAIVILASLDSVFGGISAMSRKCFDMNIFLSGFFGNAILAAILTYIGKKLDVDLYLVALIVFGTRLFTNFSVMRRHYLGKYQLKFKK